MRRLLLVAWLVPLSACIDGRGSAAGSAENAGTPDLALTESAFATLVETLSEPGGYFDTDNLPNIAFIIDIRRDNLLQQLQPIGSFVDGYSSGRYRGYLDLVTRGSMERRSENGGVAVSIQLTSSAFNDGESIPALYTCDGEDISPPLQWSNVPAETRSLALIADDPDAPVGTWVHWVIYDIPPALSELPEAVPTAEVTPDRLKQGLNDFNRIGYGGPCPPPGKPHRYVFTIYALEIEPGLPVGATKDDLLRAMEGHTIGEGRLIGLFRR